MAEPVVFSENGLIGIQVPTPDASFENAGRTRCLRCLSDLSRCVDTARFCPRCGVVLVAPPLPVMPALPVDPDVPAIPAPIATAAPPAQTAAFSTPSSLAPPPVPAYYAESEDHSLILGYANAMFRLGRRYERGLGAGRNVAEAVRCYFKAAKLGNPDAAARFAPKSMGDRDVACDDEAPRVSAD